MQLNVQKDRWKLDRSLVLGGEAQSYTSVAVDGNAGAEIPLKQAFHEKPNRGKPRRR